MTNTNIPQNSGKIKKNRCIDNLKFEGGIAKYTAVEILLDSNELAADILAANGFVLIGKDGFANYDDVWKFYGVAERYFAGVIQRNWISSRSTPDDIHKNQRGNITISARMALALSAIMYAGRNIPENSKVRQVYKSLEGTRYYSRATEKVKAVEKLAVENAQRRSVAINFVETVLKDETDAIEITPNGKMLISFTGLARLVQFVNGTSEEPHGIREAGHHTSTACKPVVISKDGETKKFDSVRECAEYIGCAVNSISRVLGGKARTVHGYTVMPA